MPQGKTRAKVPPLVRQRIFLGWREMDVLDSLMVEPMIARDLARDCGGVHYRTIMASIYKLEGKGFVERTVRTPRPLLFHITDAGRKRFALERSRGRQPGVSANECGLNKWPAASSSK